MWNMFDSGMSERFFFTDFLMTLGSKTKSSWERKVNFWSEKGSN